MKAWSFACRYETVQSHSKELQLPYRALAKMLNCQPHNIAIVQSATSAWTQASLFYAVARLFYAVPILQFLQYSQIA